MVIEFAFYIIIEIIHSIKDKPRLFIYELIFKGFAEKDQKQYQLKGRLVGDTKHYYRFKSIKLKLPSDPNCKCNWGNDTWFNCCKEEDQWKPKGSKIVPNIEKNILTINLEDLGKSTSYDIVGNYTVAKSPEDLSYSSLKVYSKKINKKSEEKKEKLKVIKCPNIRKGWLLFYMVFSMIVLYLETASAWICINNWDYFVNAIVGTNRLFGIFSVIFSIILFLFFGIILFLFIVFFLFVYWKSISGYFILMQMKKYGVPPKTEKVSEKNLISKIFEYMTGTESVDNIL